MIAIMAIFGSAMCFAQNTAGNYEAGTTALTTVSEEIAKYVPIVVKLCYAIAGVVAVVGAISVYIAMNNIRISDFQRPLLINGRQNVQMNQIRREILGSVVLGDFHFTYKCLDMKHIFLRHP
jgi:hypothetical protein